MIYDVAAKVVIDTSKETILRRFLEIELESVELIEELPQEIVSLKRSDFPLLVIQKDGQKSIVLIEIQTVFSREFELRLIDYTVRYMLKYNIEVTPFVLLLKPTSKATGVYTDKRLSFRYEIVRLWEKKAKDFQGDITIYPFIPFSFRRVTEEQMMDGGLDMLEDAEQQLYNDKDLSVESKADLLTAMAIFTGMRDKELAQKLMERRRDIMIQSPIYDIIKEEGMKEGIKEGSLKEGREMILTALDEKFGKLPSDVPETLSNINDTKKLEILLRQAIRSGSLKEFNQKLDELGRHSD